MNALNDFSMFHHHQLDHVGVERVERAEEVLLLVRRVRVKKAENAVAHGEAEVLLEVLHDRTGRCLVREVGRLETAAQLVNHRTESFVDGTEQVLSFAQGQFPRSVNARPDDKPRRCPKSPNTGRPATDRVGKGEPSAAPSPAVLVAVRSALETTLRPGRTSARQFGPRRIVPKARDPGSVDLHADKALDAGQVLLLFRHDESVGISSLLRSGGTPDPMDVDLRL